MVHLYVIPAKAGIHLLQMLSSFWIPTFAGMTTIYECSKFKQLFKFHFF
jgi:hypothetical protein